LLPTHVTGWTWSAINDIHLKLYYAAKDITLIQITAKLCDQFLKAMM